MVSHFYNFKEQAMFVRGCLWFHTSITSKSSHTRYMFQRETVQAMYLYMYRADSYHNYRSSIPVLTVNSNGNIHA